MSEIHNEHNDKEDDFLRKLDDYANSIAKQEGYITYDVVKTNLNIEGGSYLGSLYSIDIKGKTKDGEKETNVFIKNIYDGNMQLIYEVPKVYQREYFIYSELYKQFEEIQKEYNVPAAERFILPKPFKECSERSIILENLSAKDFTTYDKHYIVSLDYAELVLRNLARLHGLSMAIEKLRPDFFQNNIKNLNCLYIFDEEWNGFTRNLINVAYTSLNEDVRDKVLDKIAKIVDKYPSYMRDRSCTRTICHGDYRHSNVMVKEIDGKPVEVIAVDYQIAHFGNPVHDFIYYIFWGTDQEFRRKHLDSLRQLYHQHMEIYLQYFKIDIQDVFPKEEFDKQFTEKLDFGLMISVFYLPILFPSKVDHVDIKTAESMANMTVRVDEKYHERFRGIVDDFIKWGYL